ncbi:MAG: polymorphic toxin type 23 domain-containing protein [Cyclobacteriaceae bacterium]|nr:polymorphic toxin type 23 domain-containing protein [Cyclobacteriaceae bacterium]
MRYSYLIVAGLLLLSCFNDLPAQKRLDVGWGAKTGLMINFGTHYQRFGVLVAGYCNYRLAQINTQYKIYYNRRAPGPQEKYFEQNFNAGIAIGLMERADSLAYDYISKTGHNGTKQYVLGYAYNYYFNNIGYRQPTGTIGIRISDFEFHHENDILGRRASDGFRTAAFGLYYNKGLHQMAIKSVLWTGNKDAAGVRRVKESSFARFGYYDLSETQFGQLSHGILAFSWKLNFPFHQSAEVALGLDSEKIRNTIQNKFMHDMYFWPEKWNKARNLHIPMIDTNGKPFLYQEGQNIRKNKSFIDLSVNNEGFF